MSELWLKFAGPDGAERRVQVTGQKFVVGRHSESDLSIRDGRLSRRHVSIERFGDVFVASDAGSSNGTFVNGKALVEPAALSTGDKIELGGFLIAVEIETGSEPPPPAAKTESADAQAVLAMPASSASAAASLPAVVLIIAPLLGLALIAVIAAVLYFSSGDGRTETAATEARYSAARSEGMPADEAKSTTPPKNDLPPTAASRGGNAYAPAPSPSAAASPTGGIAADIEQNASAFLRRVALNEPNAFLTGEQARRLEPKVKQFSASSAVAANISSARQSAAKIKSMAEAGNLKPQFLAAAALARLGSTRGDVAKEAEAMLPVLEKLRTQIGSELADDALLMMAAYPQAADGDSMRMRNMLQQLTGKYPESARAIRTIWFLEKNGKISAAEFNLALDFLAIGTITQNPSAFGVNAERLEL